MSRRPAIEEVSDSEEEAEFNDDTDLPLPNMAIPRDRAPPLASTGTKGALLEEISSVDSGISGGASTSSFAAQPSRASTSGSQSFMDTFASMGMGKGGIDPDMENDPMYKQYMAARAASNVPGTTVIPPGSEKLNEFKNWTCIYPIYIDAKRAYGTGQRRVAREKSVWWPRSQEISQAALKCGLRVFHEPTKRHPRDWENPGRVKVLWKKDGKLVNPKIPSKKILFEMIAAQIQFEKPELKPDMDKLSTAADGVAAPPRGSKPAGPSSVGNKGGKSAQQLPPRPRKSIKRLLPKPPLPLPPLSERVSPYSPMISSGSLLDLWKPTADKTPGGGAPGAAGDGPGAGAGGAGAGKGKRKVIRVRG